MKTLNCEFVRSAFADVLHGQAEPELAAAIDRHVAGCDDCRAELRVVQQLLAAPVQVPAGLEARVLQNLRGAPRRARLRAPWLFAATVAFALLGGAVFFRVLQRETAPDNLVVHGQEGGLGVMGVEGALVSGSATLQDLSIEELEQLLGEMES